MRKQLLVYLMAAAAFSLHAEITETATDAVKNMGVGWNLGNTLDANGAVNGGYWGCQGLDSETYWGQPVTTAPLFEMMRNAGFGAIRVPVTWYNHMDEQGNVDAAWMHRVHEVVDYVISNGLYCILNVHHDTGADGGTYKSWIKADINVYNNVKQKYNKLWEQIADEFKDYGDHLLFESYNEMLDSKNSWCFATFAYPGQYNQTDAAGAYQAINSYAQDFVNTVRQTGSNNASRNLIVNTYAAANGYGTWNSHLKDPLTQMQLPNDAVQNHIIFEVHSYPSISNNGTSNRPMQDIKKEVDDMIAGLKTNLVSKGAPVIFGEWGTNNVDGGAGKTDYDVRRDHMLQFVEYFVQQTKANDMGTFYWMGLSDGLFRTFPAFSQPDLAECIAKAYHGKDFHGEYPDTKQMHDIVCFEGDKLLSWGNGINISGSTFATFSQQPYVILNYKQEGSSDDIQLFYGDWSQKVPFYIGNDKFNGDVNPGNYYKTPIGTEHESAISFDEATYTLVKQKGLVIHGNAIRLKKAVLSLSPTSGIEEVTVWNKDSDEVYSLTGQRIQVPEHGFYIRGGKKCIIK